jgi:uncharacterized lipoprotein YehR (DUF1307 family)
MKMYMRQVLLLLVALLLAFSLVGCGYFEDKEELAKWVKQSVQEEIKKDNAYSGLVVGEVVLVRESANKFTGYVEYKYGTETEKAKLSVTVDGNQRMYLCEPPRALIMKKGLQNLGNLFYQ